VVAYALAAHVKLTADAVRSILSRLRELGLTTYEAQAFLALVQNPDISATQLCNETGIPDSKIYFALEELHRKGLIVIREGTPRSYRALSPREALAKLKAQMSEEYQARLAKLDELRVTLEPLYKKSERSEIGLAYVMKGFDNVLSRMIEVLKTARREVILFIPDVTIYERLAPQLEGLRRNGVRIRMAIAPRMRKHVETSRYTEVREMSPRCDECWLTIVDGKTVISSSEWKTERCHAILTQDPVIIAMSEEYYESPRCCISA